jgi:superfamily II DNA or RNA helicase
VTGFLGELSLRSASWQAFERVVARYLQAAGWQSVRVVGGSGDGGADVIATRGNKRWLVQVKCRKNPSGADAFMETVNAGAKYKADVLVLASASGFSNTLLEQREKELHSNLNVQLWDIADLIRFSEGLPDSSLVEEFPERYRLREYQEKACQSVVSKWLENPSSNALVVLATGLGKTFVAATAIRRILNQAPKQRVLVLAHTNVLVRQLEKSFWPFLNKNEETLIANSEEKFDPLRLADAKYVFASRDTLVSLINKGERIPNFDIILVDECHHLGAATYDLLLEELDVGSAEGPFLMGLTATDWRPDGSRLAGIFNDPVCNIDLIQGLRSGFLTNVDYRMFTDNIDWAALRQERGGEYSPKRINKTLFIKEWDDAVVKRLKESWKELLEMGAKPRCIIFCSTIDHAKRISSQINATGIAPSEALYSGSDLSPVERNKILWRFSDGQTGILCAVDILNEGVDVPDVNLIVFQRVTHSRRIFVQQLGRGLRLAENKEKVIVLDFVNDIRRFAAGFQLQDGLENESNNTRQIESISLGSEVKFMRESGEDLEGANFLREWIGDVEALEEAGEDVSILQFPNTSLIPESR